MAATIFYSAEPAFGKLGKFKPANSKTCAPKLNFLTDSARPPVLKQAELLSTPVSITECKDDLSNDSLLWMQTSIDSVSSKSDSFCVYRDNSF